MSIFSDPSTHLAFSVFENKGVFALLLGSGVSRAAEIPTGWEITTDLVRRVAISNQVEEQHDWAKWYETTEGEQPDYSKLLGQLAKSPAERRAILERYIEPSDEEREDGKKLPTKAHNAIADLVARGFLKVIITTNFDRLLENALRDRGIEPIVISSVDALNGAEPIAHASCYIFKLHGDYKDVRILNTEEELKSYPSDYDKLLDRILDEYGLIVCGWSGDWDQALRAAILRAPNRRYPTYWAARGDLSDAAQDLTRQRDARIVTIANADGLFTTLSDRVETLEKSHVQNPLSVDLLVRSAKRLMGSPLHRIQLSDLVSDEIERVMARLDASDFERQSGDDEEEFQRCVAVYEASTEGLAKIMGLLGRWGNDDSWDFAINAIQELVTHADKLQSGTFGFPHLRTYPAVLAFVAFGIGLTRAENWPQLNRLFNVNVTKPQSEPVALSKRLFSWSWEGNNRHLWNSLMDDKTTLHYTPLSEYLFKEIFLDWARPSFGPMHYFEETYELFEVLVSINSLNVVEKDKLAMMLKKTDSNENWEHMSVGRTCWNMPMQERLFKRITSEPLLEPLLIAGFAKGDPEFLTMAIENYKRVGRKITLR